MCGRIRKHSILSNVRIILTPCFSILYFTRYYGGVLPCSVELAQLPSSQSLGSALVGSTNNEVSPPASISFNSEEVDDNSVRNGGVANVDVEAIDDACSVGRTATLFEAFEEDEKEFRSMIVFRATWRPTMT